MKNFNISSQITFLYFDEYQNALDFFENTLGLAKVYDPEWACVFRVGRDAFVGVVDASEGSIEIKARGGSLVSITVECVEDWYERMKPFNLEGMTEIKHFEDIGLRSFFFKAPEGYDFEIQEFYREELRALF